ncbi:hypothetical protein KSS87_009150, partial [Heliosperma pusillum]
FFSPQNIISIHNNLQYSPTLRSPITLSKSSYIQKSSNKKSHIIKEELEKIQQVCVEEIETQKNKEIEQETTIKSHQYRNCIKNNKEIEINLSIHSKEINPPNNDGDVICDGLDISS